MLKTTDSAPTPARRGEYSAILARVGRFSIRHKLVVVGAWILVGVALALAFPQLEAVVKEQSVDPIPAGVESFRALDAMGEAFGENGAKTTVFVAMENERGLTPAARARYDRLVAELRADPENVAAVADLLAGDVTSRQAISEDGKAWYLPVGLVGTLGGPRATESVEAVRARVTEVFADTGTVAHVTGPTATVTDQIVATDNDLLIITVATVALIAIILLVVYRSVFTALLPLLVIGVSLVVGRGIVSGLGVAGMPVSQFTIAFMTVILLGAGVDYSVFLISRYHERVRAGDEPDQAIVEATATIGRVILASAATVALAFLTMVFANLSVFATLGPACAIAVFVGFAATVTLLPVVLATAARFGLGAPRRDLTHRYWHRVGAAVVRRPVPLLALGMTGLLALSVAALGITITYDDRAGQPGDTESNLGYALLDRHFPENMVISEFLVVQSDRDMRTASSLADLDQMAARVAQLPGVTRVVGVTRPTGERLEQARLSSQNGRIGDELGKGISQARDREGDLQALRSGADQLANALGLLDREMRTGLAPLTDLLRQAQDAGATIDRYRPLLTQLAAVAPTLNQLRTDAPGLAATAEAADRAVDAAAPVLRALDAPWCAALPQCAPLADQARIVADLEGSHTFESTAELVAELNDTELPSGQALAALGPAVDKLSGGLRTLSAQDVPGQLAQLQDGVAQLAAGSRTLAGGVAALVDNTMETMAAMAQVAVQLQTSARATAASDAASGFYLPAETFENKTFAEVARQFVSADGRTVRFAIQSDLDPYSAAAMKLAAQIRTTSRDALPNTEIAGAAVSVAGFPAINADLQDLLGKDFLLLAVATIAIVGLILIALLRALVAPIFLLGTVVLNYTAALGLGVLVFGAFGQDINWSVPLLSFIVLVAVGADYNMLLVSRLREESVRGNRIGVLRTVAHTGSVITSAGVIFAASMFGLMVGSVGVMIQVGFVIGVGLLLDTFVVRTVVVPAIATLLGDASWWPRRAAQGK